MAAGVSDSIEMHRQFNVSGIGTSFQGRVTLERSFDGGVTWVERTIYHGCALIPGGFNSTTVDEPEAGVLYRFKCTARTSGSITCRLSQ